MMRAAIMVTVLASGASASPLAPLWRAGKNCPQLYAQASDAILALDDKRAQLSRIDPQTGKILATLPMPKLSGKADERRFERTIGNVAVLITPGELVAIDATTAKVVWRRAFPKLKLWPPHVVAFGADAVVSYTDGKAMNIERIEPSTGKSRWKVKLDKLASGYWLGAGPTRIFAIDQSKAKTPTWTLVSLDPSDGHTLWTTTINNGKSTYASTVMAGDDLAMAMASDELVLIQGADGKHVSVSMYAQALEGANGRAYTSADNQLLAFDIATGKLAWKSPQNSFSPLVEAATASTVYVHDQDLLREVDAATGKTVAIHGVGDTPYIYFRATAPAITYCDGKELVALDPSAAQVPESTVAVQGTLTCSDCEDPRIDVRVGDSRTKTDDKGHFTITAKGRGKLSLMWQFGNEWQAARVLDAGKPTIDVGKVEVQSPPQGD
jgi:outer membrane protein assembly factor BamB